MQLASSLGQTSPLFPLWLDGTDGQEDELDDVHKGILDPPTDDEGPGSIDEPPRHDPLEDEDEEDFSIGSQQDEDDLRRERTKFPH